MSLLAFAYACEPDKGSEPGVGWQWVCMLRDMGRPVCVITRSNNKDAIEAALAEMPDEDRPRFEYVDLPKWARRWKKGQRGIRLYYVLWQIAALLRARRLMKEQEFDTVWHLTLANAMLGSLAPLLGRNFVYGPVGGGVTTPVRMVPTLGIAGFVFESARWIARGGFRYLNPIARLAWHRAALILVQNPETRDWIPRRHRWKVEVFPNAIVEGKQLQRITRVAGPSRTAIFAGRLVPLKGLILALRAMKHLPQWRLLICGSGPDEKRLRKAAHRYGVSDRVHFLGWVPRGEVMRLMREEADVLLFPSFHDEAGLAVAEAVACGLPAVCIARGGPPLLGATAVHAVAPEATAEALAAAVLEVADTRPGPSAHGLNHRERLGEILSERGIAS